VARRKVEVPAPPEEGEQVQTKLGPATLIKVGVLGSGYVRLADGTERWIPKDWLEGKA
jgi:hypothetical protein